MLAFESDSGTLWLDGVIGHEPVHQSPRQLSEHFKLYGTLTDVFDDYERVSMLTEVPVIDVGQDDVYKHSLIGGIRRSNSKGWISWAVHRPQLYRLKNSEGIDYFGFDSVSEPIVKRIGTFFAITPEATFAITSERVVPAQPATIRAIRKLTERYVIL